MTGATLIAALVTAVSAVVLLFGVFDRCETRIQQVLCALSIIASITWLPAMLIINQHLTTKTVTLYENNKDVRVLFVPEDNDSVTIEGGKELSYHPRPDKVVGGQLTLQKGGTIRQQEIRRATFVGKSGATVVKKITYTTYDDTVSLFGIHIAGGQTNDLEIELGYANTEDARTIDKLLEGN